MTLAFAHVNPPLLTDGISDLIPQHWRDDAGHRIRGPATQFVGQGCCGVLLVKRVPLRDPERRTENVGPAEVPPGSPGRVRCRRNGPDPGRPNENRWVFGCLPTSKADAMPVDRMAWSRGLAFVLVAASCLAAGGCTGSDELESAGPMNASRHPLAASGSPSVDPIRSEPTPGDPVPETVATWSSAAQPVRTSGTRLPVAAARSRLASPSPSGLSTPVASTSPVALPAVLPPGGQPTATLAPSGSATPHRRFPRGWIQYVGDGVDWGGTEPDCRDTHVAGANGLTVTVERLQLADLCFTGFARSPVPVMTLISPTGAREVFTGEWQSPGDWVWRLQPGLAGGPLPGIGTYTIEVAGHLQESGGVKKAVVSSGRVIVVPARLPRVAFSGGRGQWTTSLYRGEAILVQVAGYPPDSEVHIAVDDDNHRPAARLPSVRVGRNGEGAVRWSVPTTAASGWHVMRLRPSPEEPYWCWVETCAAFAVTEEVGRQPSGGASP
ncbi:hypothetical protein QLQ12_44200 [Actinoplanes sp. NEAU-A12]|uniref:Uncharacterized protein n=1 Tax=Actinoplanes sandaracinus TaxID=3045177 RepID=A0ABT6X193_9ACTN|nr:hypothetical protein [Actinoplanes sandaracinus]MDI6105605.1 hypothetical protein [Actinoplanes sandaracinus]